MPRIWINAMRDSTGISVIHDGEVQFIIQYNDANKGCVSRFDTNNILFDGSGGLGKVPEQWLSPLDGKLCGYAGGLGQDNLYQELQSINQSAKGNNVWIDMESNLRNPITDKFDLEKVELAINAIFMFEFLTNHHFTES